MDLDSIISRMTVFPVFTPLRRLSGDVSNRVFQVDDYALVLNLSNRMEYADLFTGRKVYVLEEPMSTNVSVIEGELFALNHQKNRMYNLRSGTCIKEFGARIYSSINLVNGKHISKVDGKIWIDVFTEELMPVPANMSPRVYMHDGRYISRSENRKNEFLDFETGETVLEFPCEVSYLISDLAGEPVVKAIGHSLFYNKSADIVLEVPFRAHPEVQHISGKDFLVSTNNNIFYAVDWFLRVRVSYMDAVEHLIQKDLKTTKLFSSNEG